MAVLAAWVTMGHTPALAVDVALAFSAALLATRQRRAEWMGLSYVLQGFSLRLEDSRVLLPKSAFTAWCLITATAFVVAVQKSPVADAIALHENRIGLIYRYAGDSEAVELDIVVGSEMRSRFDEVTYVRILGTRQHPWADKMFHTD